jgi:ABC-type branched-subunit amino acid transport system substrate-binding protein
MRIASHARRAIRRAHALLLVTLLAAVLGGAHAQRVVIGMVLPDLETGTALERAVARSADEGTTMVAEEFAFNAEMFALDFEVAVERANDPEAAVRAAETLVAEREAFAVVGGFGAGVAEALSAWSAERGVPFLNVGSSSDALRNEACERTAFHVEPSAAMYVDGLAGWYVRSGFRRWYVVHADDAEGEALRERVAWSLRERHFGARIVGTSSVPAGGGDVAAAVTAARRADADLLLLLVSAEDQLRWLAEFDAAGLEAEVAGFPHPQAQTRAFFQAARDASPRLGAAFRSLAFEATLDAYGARELNARYRATFGHPMEPPAWAAYQAVKMLFEAATFGGSTEHEAVRAYLSAPTTVFDLYKGIGTSFRPWDRQLRQSIYLVEISETEPDPFSMAILVGELPAIYLPGTEVIERLDQIGDLAAESRCRP